MAGDIQDHNMIMIADSSAVPDFVCVLCELISRCFLVRTCKCYMQLICQCLTVCFQGLYVGKSSENEDGSGKMRLVIAG